jgi:hypothetical protein
MIKGKAGNWDSYPVYHTEAFQKVKQTFEAFTRLYERDMQTPMDELLNNAVKGKPIWQPLRSNASSVLGFEKACIQRVDALRILQFLKETNQQYPGSNEERLSAFLQSAFNPDEAIKNTLQHLSFSLTGIDALNNVRNFMANCELNLQQKKGTV